MVVNIIHGGWQPWWPKAMLRRHGPCQGPFTERVQTAARFHV